MITILRALLVLLILASLAACGGGGGDETQTNTSPSISLDTGFLPATSATTSAGPRTIHGRSSISVSLPSSSVSRVGCNLILRLDGSVYHTQNVNGSPAFIGGVASFSALIDIDDVVTLPAGAHVLEYRWVANWVDASGATVTVNNAAETSFVDVSIN